MGEHFETYVKKLETTAHLAVAGWAGSWYTDSPLVSSTDLTPRLRAAGLITTAAPRFEPLAGGVSSDIVLVRDGDRSFVTKRALGKLKVRDDWFADASRNAVERSFLDYAASVVPGCVPRVLAGDPDAGWFAMEHLGGDLANWKDLLLSGVAEPDHARRAGDVLGRLHHASWGDDAVRERFPTLRNFHALRIEPYLLTTAARVPGARAALEAEAARLAGSSIALVHGDYSPKNILVSSRRLVLLDAEVAWFGDPAFDTAFLLNHLHLKALVHRGHPEPFLALAGEFWRSYASALAGRDTADLESRTVRLMLCLMLARVHGKSPAEYLAPEHRSLITGFVLRLLGRNPATVAEAVAEWRATLSSP